MLKIDRRLIAHFEWPLLTVMLLIITCGLLTILSATYSPGRAVSGYVYRQAIWTGIGLGVLLITLSFDYRLFDRYGYLPYAAVVFLLILVPFAGTTVSGSRTANPRLV